MKFSLVIVAYQAEEQLKQCLASLEQHPPANSDREAEIIVVDNSPEAVDIPNKLLHSLLLKYVRVIIVRDGKNRGFAEGCNEGVRHSHGKTLVFINPDTQVTAGWAERMAGYFNPTLMNEQGIVGAVGPISNFVAGLQRADIHMQLSGNIEETAAMAATVLEGRGVDTKLLIGFFLMIPREAWDKVGGMDPGFFLGCDDLDLSLRLRDAGYSLVIASDVFIYHEGHASFYEMGEKAVTLNKQSEKYLLKKLRDKYGDNIPTSTELWGCEILPTEAAPPMTLSVCMIVRDEEENLEDLLPQLTFADQIVIVDTKPDRDYPFQPEAIELWVSEKFPTLAGKVTAGLLPWTDHYSTARNFALSLCRSQWVLWLDADDRVPTEAAGLIRAALDSPGPLTARQKCHFSFRLRDHLPNGKLGYCDQPRLFPNIPGIFWEGKVHENYMVRADALGLTLVQTGITIDHWGYSDADMLAQKHRRNVALLESDIDSPLKYYHLGKSKVGLRDFPAARKAWQTCLDMKWEKPLARDFVEQLRYLMALCLYQEQGKAVDAMDHWLIANPKPDALFLRGERAFVEGKLDEAEAIFREYANFGEIMDFYGTDRDTFQPCADSRLDQIERLRGMVVG